jgi:hypothetical protein
MDQPKFTLYFYSRNPGSPFVIKESAIVEHGQLAERHHSCYTNLQDGLEALGRLSKKPVVVAFTQETVFYDRK